MVWFWCGVGAVLVWFWYCFGVVLCGFGQASGSKFKSGSMFGKVRARRQGVSSNLGQCLGKLGPDQFGRGFRVGLNIGVVWRGVGVVSVLLWCGFGLVLVSVWYGFGVVLVLCWCCVAMVLVWFCCGFGVVMDGAGMVWRGLQVFGLVWRGFGVILVLWCGFSVVLEWFWCCIGVVLVWFWCGFGKAPGSKCKSVPMFGKVRAKRQGR